MWCVFSRFLFHCSPNEANGLVLFATILLFALGGCATIDDTPPVAATKIAVEGNSYDEKAFNSKPETYGTIGLVSARFDPVIEFNDVRKGKDQGSLKGAMKGAQMGAKPGQWLMKNCTGNVGCVYVWALGGELTAVGAVVGAIVGGVAGAITADSEKTVQEKEARAKAVLAELKSQEAMRDRVERYANKRGGPMFVKLSDAGPTSPYEEASYQSLAPQKIDAVLEITVTSLGMHAADNNKEDIDPPLAVFIKARTRLVQTKNNTVVHDRPYIFESEARTFSEWNADNGRLTAESLTQGYQQIAEQVFHYAF